MSTAGPLEVRPDARVALAAGRPLALSVREFELLVALARRPDRVLSREEIFDGVWGGELRPGDRSVDVYIRKLRVKLEKALPDWRFIHTHVGFGYRFTPEEAEDEIRLQAHSHAFHIEATSL